MTIYNLHDADMRKPPQPQQHLIQLTPAAFSKLKSMQTFYYSPPCEEEEEEPLTFSEVIEIIYDNWCDDYGTPDVEVG